MSPRTGRPTSEPKKHETRIRMSDKDIEKLEFYKDELPTEIYQKLYKVLKNYIPTISIFTR